MAMLFAQAAFALASCDEYRAQSRALLAAAQNAGGAPCHESGVNANLCLTHCQGGDQTLDKHQVKVPEPAVAPSLATARLDLYDPPSARLARLPQPFAGPPPRIRFRTLLI